ncbi:hypothetical protein LUZ60_016516 [Juncus effusus]|nr:hypothetical protein LUZ60_016516 [Juncus effusus]
MAMIADAFVGLFIDRLTDFVKDRAVSLFGIEDEISRLQEKTRAIQIFLIDAEKRRIKDSAVNHWLQDLKEALYEAEDLIDLCRFEASKLLDGQQSSSVIPSIISWFKAGLFRHKISNQIKNLNNQMDSISNNNLVHNLERITKTERQITAVDRRQTSSLLEPDIIGKEIQEATEILMEAILDEKSQKISTIAITGMGGIGKTTLAQNLHNDPRISTNFQERVWICVSQNYSETDLLKDIIRNISGGEHKKGQNIGELKTILSDALKEKSFFLVLDDVWRSDVWTNLLRTPLQSCNNGKILITTRDKSIALSMGALYIHQAETMSVESGWELLLNSTFLNTKDEIENLKNLGVEIVKKCGGLPLAIRTIAGLLATKDRNKREWEKIVKSEAWNMNELPEELRGALYLSYEDLPRNLKQCFLYCSLYPEDWVINREDLIRYWVAEGFIEEKKDELMEEKGEDYYNELICRSLLIPDPKRVDQVRCKMHDLLRSLGRHLSQSESFCGNPNSLDFVNLSKIKRISVFSKEDSVEIMGRENEVLKLRSFVLLKMPPIVEAKLFRRLPFLRVLRINGQELYTVPESLGDLIHLRLLDLDQTSIYSLPESIKWLKNLQILNLSKCKLLQVLPFGLTSLSNLRRLGLRESPISQFPKGLRKLKYLNDLAGFVVCKNTEMNGWDLKEIEDLSFMRRLDINYLERAVPLVSQNSSVSNSVLENKSHLRFLQLSCTPQSKRAGRKKYTEEEIHNIERVFEELSPPACLDRLVIWEYFGTKYPKWLKTNLPLLTSIHFQNCASCSNLPPLGQLPYLKFLKIVGAFSVKSIGPEFLGNNNKLTAFPKLEALHIQQMPKWEEWILDESDKGILVFPRLSQLDIIDCPKLKSLPEELNHAASLKRVRIKGAHKMNVIENLPYLSEKLEITSCSGLKRVLNMHLLRNICITDCPALRRVEGLDSLQCLQLVNESMETIPNWVLGFVKKRKFVEFDCCIELRLICNARVLERCQVAGPDWPVLEMFSRVRASTGDNKAVLEYTKQPFSFSTTF